MTGTGRSTSGPGGPGGPDRPDRPGRDEEHQRLRELLGSYALGHLDDASRSRVRAHLDGCAACSADLAEIAPLGPLLASVDPASFDLPVLPPPDLGGAIRARVAQERRVREVDELQAVRERARRRTAVRTALGSVAAVVALVALVGGVLIGRGTAPQSAGSAAGPTPAPATITVAPAVPMESIDLVVAEPRIDTDTSGLVAHTWGVELRMSGRGFERGEVFSAAFRDAASGELRAAGAFLGTGRQEMTCNLQSALLRTQASEVVVTDSSGEVVLTASL